MLKPPLHWRYMTATVIPDKAHMAKWSMGDAPSRIEQLWYVSYWVYRWWGFRRHREVLLFDNEFEARMFAANHKGTIVSEWLRASQVV